MIETQSTSYLREYLHLMSLATFNHSLYVVTNDLDRRKGIKVGKNSTVSFAYNIMQPSGRNRNPRVEQIVSIL